MSNWGDWSPCDPSCENSKRTNATAIPQRWRNRHIIQHPLHGGYECEGSMDQTEECNFCKENEVSKEEETGARQCVRYCPGRNIHSMVALVTFES